MKKYLYKLKILFLVIFRNIIKPLPNDLQKKLNSYKNKVDLVNEFENFCRYWS